MILYSFFPIQSSWLLSSLIRLPDFPELRSSNLRSLLLCAAWPVPPAIGSSQHHHQWGSRGGASNFSCLASALKPGHLFSAISEVNYFNLKFVGYLQIRDTIFDICWHHFVPTPWATGKDQPLRYTHEDMMFEDTSTQVENNYNYWPESLRVARRPLLHIKKKK